MSSPRQAAVGVGTRPMKARPRPSRAVALLTSLWSGHLAPTPAERRGFYDPGAGTSPRAPSHSCVHEVRVQTEGEEKEGGRELFLLAVWLLSPQQPSTVPGKEDDGRNPRPTSSTGSPGSSAPTGSEEGADPMVVWTPLPLRPLLQHPLLGPRERIRTGQALIFPTSWQLGGGHLAQCWPLRHNEFAGGYFLLLNSVLEGDALSCSSHVVTLWHGP